MFYRNGLFEIHLININEVIRLIGPAEKKKKKKQLDYIITIVRITWKDYE